MTLEELKTTTLDVAHPSTSRIVVRTPHYRCHIVFFEHSQDYGWAAYGQSRLPVDYGWKPYPSDYGWAPTQSAAIEKLTAFLARSGKGQTS